MTNDLLPKPTVLINNELATLEFLKTNSTIYTKYWNIYKDAHHFWSLAKARKDVFSFESFLDVNHDGRYLRIYFGTLITVGRSGTYSNLSNHLTVCEGTQSPSKILRKFHFDFAPPKTGRRQPHPLFHLQYCGSLSPYLKKRGFDRTHIEHMASGSGV